MKVHWHTVWQGHHIAICRDDVEVDRFDAQQVERVLLLYKGSGDFPGDVVQVVVELPEECLVFGAETGFAGRVNFERQPYWQERRCIYWVAAPLALLPWRLRAGAWRGEANNRAFRRLRRDELAGCAERWQLEGPQTWEDRKRRRIERSRPFGFTSSGAHA